jgi:hypothetical protein
LLVPNRDGEQGMASRGVRSVDHALAILVPFYSGTFCLGLSDLRQRRGLSDSTVHTLLALLDRGGVRWDVRPGMSCIGARASGSVVEFPIEASNRGCDGCRG